MTTAELTTVPAEIDRDRYGRPMVIPPGGGKKVAYTRATTVAGAIDDLNGLITWKISRAVLGIIDRPDLLLKAAARRGDKQDLYRICDEALEAGAASAAANIGTALHALTEQIDRGQPVGTVPDAYRADITAYEKVMQPFERLHIEELLVCDELQVAGTPDLVVRFEGRNYIADKKSGSVDFPHKMAAQLALYAHSQIYDIRTGQRTPLSDVDLERGIIIHIPAGEGRCELQWIDIAAGWEAVQLAIKVREWRKRKGLLEPLSTVVATPFAAAQGVIAAAGLEPVPVPASYQEAGYDRDDVHHTILGLIEQATTTDDLVAVWAANEQSWTPEHTAAASARKRTLTQTA